MDGFIAGMLVFASALFIVGGIERYISPYLSRIADSLELWYCPNTALIWWRAR